MYQTTRGASSPSEVRGGINPMQVGLGVKVAAIETVHSQGQLEFTGNRTDMAIEGDGYYVVGEGSSQLFTRAGNFLLDANGNMVQSGTGYMVKGFKMAPDPQDPTSYTMGSGLVDINIPVGQKIPAKATTLAGFRCNLDSRVGAYLPMGIEANDSSLRVNVGTDQFVLGDISGGNTAATFFTLSTPSGAATPAGIVCEYAGIDNTSGYPRLNVSVTGEFDSTHLNLTPQYDSATGTLTLTNSSGVIVSRIELSGFMNFTMITDSSSGTAVNYLVEFDDHPATGNRILNIWPQGAEPESLPITMNNDGTFQCACCGSGRASPLSARATANAGITILNTATGCGSHHQPEDRKRAQHEDGRLRQPGQRPYPRSQLGKIDNNQWRWRAWLPPSPASLSPTTPASRILTPTAR